MEQIITWFKDYSPALAIVLIAGSAALYILKVTAEKAVSAGFQTHARILEKRSEFEQKILVDRFERVTTLSSVLDSVMVIVRRIIDGQPEPDNFWYIYGDRCEIMPMRLFEEQMSTAAFLLGADFIDLLKRKQVLVLRANNAALAAIQAKQESMAGERPKIQAEWVDINEAWKNLSVEFKSAMEQSFHLESIHW